MRILCVIDSLGSGGAQRQMVGLAIGFKEKGHDVSFLTYHHINFFERYLKDEDIKVHTISNNNYLLRLLSMRRYIRNGNYDVVLSFLTSSNFITEVSSIPSRNWKLIVGERSANPNILRSFKLKVFRVFHLLADHVTANSNINIDIVRRVNPFLSKQKCHVIYNMVDLEKWATEHTVPSRCGSKFKILVAARHHKLKNLLGLVEGVNLLTKEEQKQLVIEWYGDNLPSYIDTSFDEAVKKIKNNELEHTFNFYPATHDIVEKIKGADAVGLFSFYEGFPNVVCEAMASGKPVIASRISDLPSILGNNKCLLFNPEDHKQIRDSIRCLLKLNSSELIEIGNANKSIAEQLFNRETIVSQYLTLMN